MKDQVGKTISGYRLYLDWRNAFDILEKKEVIVLPLVGQDGFDSYHEMKRLGC
jgi:hypothetical protein